MSPMLLPRIVVPGWTGVSSSFLRSATRTNVFLHESPLEPLATFFRQPLTQGCACRSVFWSSALPSFSVEQFKDWSHLDPYAALPAAGLVVLVTGTLFPVLIAIQHRKLQGTLNTIQTTLLDGFRTISGILQSNADTVMKITRQYAKLDAQVVANCDAYELEYALNTLEADQQEQLEARLNEQIDQLTQLVSKVEADLQTLRHIPLYGIVAHNLLDPPLQKYEDEAIPMIKAILRGYKNWLLSG